MKLTLFNLKSKYNNNNNSHEEKIVISLIFG